MASWWLLLAAAAALVVPAWALPLAQPSTNVFPRDSVLTLYVDREASGVCKYLDADCLSPVFALPFGAPEGKQLSTIPLPPSVCTLPAYEPNGLRSLGHLTLSGNGLFSSLVCYRSSPGSSASAIDTAGTTGPGFTVLFIASDGSIDDSTRLLLPAGVRPFSAVTDNGTNVWIATSRGLYHTHAGDNTGLAWTHILDTATHPAFNGGVTGADDAIHHASLVATMASTTTTVLSGSTEMWLSTNRGVYATTGGAMPLPGGPPATYTLRLPNPSNSSRAIGHAAAFVARGGKLYSSDPHDTVWTDDLQTPVLPPVYAYPNSLVSRAPAVNSSTQSFTSIHAAFVGHENKNGRNVFPFLSSAATGVTAVDDPVARWRRMPFPGDEDVVVDALQDTPYLAAQSSRYLNPLFDFTFKGKRRVGWFGRPLANVYATVPWGLYNVTVSTVGQRGDKVFATTIMYRAELWELKKGRFLGVSLAPFVVGYTSPATEPTPLSTPSPSPNYQKFATITPTPSQGAYMTMSPTSSPFPANAGDRGMRDPQASNFPEPPSGLGDTTKPIYLVLVRVGDNSTSAPDYRYIGNERERLTARPLFVDLVAVTRVNGQYAKASLVLTMALPRKETGPHHACTSVFAPRMWPRLLMADGFDSFGVGCYGAEAGKDLIPDSYNVPISMIPEISNGTVTSGFDAFGFAYPWPQHPRRVAANIYSSAHVDTRTSFDPAGPCGKVRLNTASRVQSYRYGPRFYVTSGVFEDAPASEYGGKCGIRYVAIGASDDDGLRFTAEETRPLEDNIKTAHYFQGQLYVWVSGPGREQPCLAGWPAWSAVIEPPTPWDKPSPGISPFFVSASMAQVNIRRGEAGDSPIIAFSSASGEHLTGAYVADRTKPGLVKLGIRDWERTIFEEFSQLPPDNRSISDMIATEYTAQGVYNPDTEGMELDLTAQGVFVVTAEMTDKPPHIKAGSALWYFRPATGAWTLLMELPCCTSLWVAVGEHKLAVPRASNSPNPGPTTSTPSPTASAALTAASSYVASPSAGLLGGIDANGATPLGAGASSSGGAAGAGIGIAIAVIAIALCGGCVGAAYWRYRRIVNRRKAMLMALHDKETKAATVTPGQDGIQAAESDEEDDDEDTYVDDVNDDAAPSSAVGVVPGEAAIQAAIAAALEECGREEEQEEEEKTQHSEDVSAGSRLARALMRLSFALTASEEAGGDAGAGLLATSRDARRSRMSGSTHVRLSVTSSEAAAAATAATGSARTTLALARRSVASGSAMVSSGPTLAEVSVALSSAAEAIRAAAAADATSSNPPEADALLPLEVIEGIIGGLFSSPAGDTGSSSSGRLSLASRAAIPYRPSFVASQSGLVSKSTSGKSEAARSPAISTKVEMHGAARSAAQSFRSGKLSSSNGVSVRTLELVIGAAAKVARLLSEMEPDSASEPQIATGHFEALPEAALVTISEEPTPVSTAVPSPARQGSPLLAGPSAPSSARATVTSASIGMAADRKLALASGQTTPIGHRQHSARNSASGLDAGNASLSPLLYQPSAGHVLRFIVGGALARATELELELGRGAVASTSPDASKSASAVEAAVEKAAYDAGRKAILAAQSKRRAAVVQALARLSAQSAAHTPSVTRAAATPGAKLQKVSRKRPKSTAFAGSASSSSTSAQAPSSRASKEAGVGARPTLAELERRYGPLLLSGGASKTADDADGFGLEPPPGFLPYLLWFVKTQALALLGCCTGKQYQAARRRGQRYRFSVATPGNTVPNFSAAARALAAHYGYGAEGGDGSAAAFAALGLDQQDSGAFVASNSLLKARAENLTASGGGSAVTVSAAAASPLSSPRPAGLTRKSFSALPAPALVAATTTSNGNGSAIVVNPLALAAAQAR